MTQPFIIHVAHPGDPRKVRTFVCRTSSAAADFVRRIAATWGLPAVACDWSIVTGG